MVTIVLPIIFLIIMFVFFILFLAITKRQDKDLKTMDNTGKIKEQKKVEDNSKAINNNDKKSAYKKEDVFKFMEFDKILNNMIAQNNGSRFTMAVKCKGINYDLMSEVEQLAVEEGFITFLNTLKYPIQLYVQAQNIDLKSVIERYKDNTASISLKYDEINREYSKLASNFDVDERKLDNLAKERDSISNVYEYAADMISYVEKMSVNKNLLQRNFYVLISYNTSEIPAVDKFNKDEIVEMCYTELTTRCQAILSALSSCSVSGNILNSNDLADLLYSAYNRDDKGLMSVQEALDSGVFRLYSTSEDAIYRKTVALDEYLRNEAKIRALEAMKDVIINDQIETPASRVIDEEEEISKRATNMIKSEDYDQDFKNKVNRKILNDFRETKKTLLEEDKRLKKEYKEDAEKQLENLENLKNQEKPEGIKLMERAKELEKEGKVDKEENNNIEEKNIESGLIEDKIEENNVDKVENTNDDNNYDDQINSVYSLESEEDDSIV